jgi:hypothetical protein
MQPGQAESGPHSDNTPSPLTNVITMDRDRSRTTSTASCGAAWRRGETLNALFDAEADRRCKASATNAPRLVAIDGSAQTPKAGLVG